MSCEVIGWCAVLSKDWMGVWAGMAAALATFLASGIALVAVWRDHHRERTRRSALQRLSKPLLISELEETARRARLVQRAALFHVGPDPTPQSEEELEFSLGYTSAHIHINGDEGRLRRLIEEAGSSFDLEVFHGMRDGILTMPSEIIDLCGGVLGGVKEVRNTASLLGRVVPGATSPNDIDQRVRAVHAAAVDLIEKSERALRIIRELVIDRG